MSTKYSVSRSTRWQWDYKSGHPNFTQHALQRYDERTPSWSSSPETAWLNGIDVSDLAPYLEDSGGQQPETVKYYAESNTERVDWHGIVLLVDDDSIVTCYTHRSLSRLDNGTALQAFLRTIALEEGFL